MIVDQLMVKKKINHHLVSRKRFLTSGETRKATINQDKDYDDLKKKPYCEMVKSR